MSVCVLQDAHFLRYVAVTTNSPCTGGRMVFLNAEEILYAKSGGNYVEVFTDSTMHLARMTMSSLENLLDETGGHIRVHRSYICLLYTSPSPRDRTRSRMPSSA